MTLSAQVTSPRHAIGVVDQRRRRRHREVVDQAIETGGPTDQASLELAGVYLLTAESDGQAAVPGLTVALDRSGLTVRKPTGEVSAVLGWAQLSGVSANGRMRTPVGRPGLVLEARTASKAHRFVVPSDDPDALEQEIVRLAAAAPKPRKRAGASRALAAVVAVIVVAGITLAALVASGAVKF